MINNTRRPKQFALFSFAILLSLLVGCAHKTEPDQTSSAKIVTSTSVVKPKKAKHIYNPETAPEWVVRPQIRDALAATACVKAKTDFALTKKHATNLAKANLYTYIVERLEKVEQVIASKNTTTAELSSGREQLIEEQIKAARALKVNYVEIEQDRHLCVMLALNKAQSELTLSTILESANYAVNEEEKRKLVDLFING